MTLCNYTQATVHIYWQEKSHFSEEHWEYLLELSAKIYNKSFKLYPKYILRIFIAFSVSTVPQNPFTSSLLKVASEQEDEERKGGLPQTEKSMIGKLGSFRPFWFLANEWVIAAYI